MCAVPGPLSDCSPGTVELLFFLKLSFHSPIATGWLRWGCSGVGRGWLSDFNNIDRHFSIVKKSHNSFDELYRAIVSPISSQWLWSFANEHFWNEGRQKWSAVWQSHSCGVWHSPSYLVSETKSAAWLKRAAYNDSLFYQFSFWGKSSDFGVPCPISILKMQTVTVWPCSSHPYVVYFNNCLLRLSCFCSALMTECKF